MFEDSDGIRIDFGRIAKIVFASWGRLLLAFIVGFTLAGAFVVRLPNVYRSTVILAPVKSDSGVASGLRSQLGGLAAIAGVDLGGGGASKSIEALATLRSAGFVRDFVEEDQLLPILFAEKWDVEKKKWKPSVAPPTAEDGVVSMRDKILTVIEDRKTSLVTLNVDWTDREMAASWANRLVERINARMRARAIAEAGRSIEYLEKELSGASAIELRQAIFRLIELQINSSMVANVQPEFAFKVIDKATPADSKRNIGPKRVAMAIAGGFVSLVVFFLAVLFRTRHHWYGGK